jgi:predicted secreted protein
MKWTSAVAIYFILWWVTLFVVLPFGVKNAAETGEAVEEGNDAGAPISHGLAWKAIVTTVLASVIFVVLYWVLVNEMLNIGDLPFIRDMPRL